MTTEALEGLRVVQTLVANPRQWRMLLCLMNGPQSTTALAPAGTSNRWWLTLGALWGLWRHRLIVFHVKQRVWTLSPTGQSLRPVFTAILACTHTENGGQYR
ncbi:hypothetical protein [Levilactobacillus namurensis]|uniref:hypothetical protein n=1 Tax=Levilactobacillus namurensis TaxID=380393 RepID=UPI0004670232|nr:hypothetical protein [Levilactobacillus namurensis]